MRSRPLLVTGFDGAFSNPSSRRCLAGGHRPAQTQDDVDLDRSGTSSVPRQLASPPESLRPRPPHRRAHSPRRPCDVGASCEPRMPITCMAFLSCLLSGSRLSITPRKARLSSSAWAASRRNSLTPSLRLKRPWTSNQPLPIFHCTQSPAGALSPNSCELPNPSRAGALQSALLGAGRSLWVLPLRLRAGSRCHAGVAGWPYSDSRPKIRE